MSLEDKKALLSHPGELIEETLESIGMSQAELAERLGRSAKFVNEIVKGRAHITSEIAYALEVVIGYTAKGWLKLDRKYQDELMEIQQMEYKAKCADWVSKFPLKFMREKGLIAGTKDKQALVGELLSFFRVKSPNEYHNIYNEASLAFKIELKHTKDPEAIAVWLRLGELDAAHYARNSEFKSFDKRKLKSMLPAIKELSYKMEEGWHIELKNILAECGVALSYSPMIKLAPIYGAARWIMSKSVPLIQVTDRGKDANKFWFTLYHEIGHILLHGKKDIFIEGDAATLHELEMDKDKEHEADRFAEKCMFTTSQQLQLEAIIKETVTEKLIESLSTRMKVNRSFIISKLQRMGTIDYKTKINSMKMKVDYATFD